MNGEAATDPDLGFLDLLQDKMEERLARTVPAGGRFCGNCYARLQEGAVNCPFCKHAVDSAGTVPEIPQEVLRAYRSKQRTEAAWVYGFGFVGLILASGLFLVLVLWGPGLLGHPALGFTVLIGGGYVLARLLGEVIGGYFGLRRGVQRRNEMWCRFCASRDRGPGAGATPRS